MALVFQNLVGLHVQAEPAGESNMAGESPRNSSSIFGTEPPWLGELENFPATVGEADAMIMAITPNQQIDHQILSGFPSSD